MPEALVLIDGSSFLYRAYYAAKTGFTTSTGVPTGATLIISSMLRRLMERYRGLPMAAVFDARGGSFRNELYPEYKANRPKMPEDLVVQIENVQRLVRALGLPLISVPGVEADDVLGSYAKACEQVKRSSIICTGDKDLAQLVNDHITLYDSMNEKTYDRAAVIEKYGVPPELIIDLLALKGDSSDNIPGMSKVGDVTAVSVLQGIGGIKDIEAHPELAATLSFRGAKTFAARFMAELPIIKLSYQLASIKTDVPLPIPLDELKPPVPQHLELLKLYRELEFRRLYQDEVRAPLYDTVPPGTDLDAAASADGSSDKLAPLTAEELARAAAAVKAQDPAPAEPAAAAPAQELQTFESAHSHFILVNTPEKLDALCAAIKEAGAFAFDTETDSLQAQTCKLVGISCAVKPLEGWYIPLGHDYVNCPQQLTLDEVKAQLQPLFADPAVKKYGHNVKFDLLVLHFAAGIEVQGVYADSMLAAHLLNSVQRVSLDALAAKYLHYRTMTFAEVTGGSRHASFAQVDGDKAAIYSGEDAEVSLRLCQVLLQELADIPSLNDLFFKQEMPFMQVLYHMERTGAYVSAAELKRQNEKLNAELLKVQSDIFAAAGSRFNLSSPKQLGQMLFVTLGIPYPRKVQMKNGAPAYSTAEEILQDIAPQYDIANLILRSRTLSKLTATYTEKLPTLIQPDGRIYTSFNQAGTVTFRLSSSDPNLQNIPARTPEGRQVRQAFCAPEGYKILSADYSQIELRLIAHIAKVPALIEAFNHHQDIHRATAAEVLGKPIAEVTDAERAHAKATNFGLMYGMSAHGLSRQTGMSYKEASAYVENYFKRYPQVPAYMEAVKKQAHEQEYVTTLLGHRISFDSINAANARSRSGAERAAVNAPMQGSAAEIIKEAMLKIDHWIGTLPPGLIRMTLQVHDELVFEVKEDFADEAAARIKDLMENVVQLDVPLEVGIGIADNWAQAH